MSSILTRQIWLAAMFFAVVLVSAFLVWAGTSVANANGKGATVSHINCTFGGFDLPDSELSGLVFNVDGLVVENSNGTDLTCKGNVTVGTDDRTLTLVAADSSHPIKGNAIAVLDSNAGAACTTGGDNFTFDFTIHYSAGGTAMIKCHFPPS